jgi:hypothetical protein
VRIIPCPSEGIHGSAIGLARGAGHE